ncbi:hypothetical protein [Kitasatospora viridis]|uniref:Uncharacterized protein n=1 Tax=Kitasatospora viridis TaxID=281105 RepID=A0A561UN31_9ACTN|nr:hypothetical protein [Kitasatospora viridis]TWG00734.1 hypothetical protein FHX73_114614 [Kitasatospora viridis]
MADRYWCGECGFRTPWLTRAEGARRLLDHHRARHPGVPPTGHLESTRRPSAPVLLLVGAGLLLLALALLAAACGTVS